MPRETGNNRSGEIQASGILGLVLQVLRHPSTVPTITQIAALVVLCWVVWHGVTTTIPSIQQGFHEELGRERAMYREEMKLLRTEIQKDRVSYETITRKLAEAVDTNQKTIMMNQANVLMILEEIKKSRIRSEEGREPLPMPKETKG